MQKVKMVPTLDLIETANEAKLNWRDLYITDYAENDSYVPLNCSDGELENIYCELKAGYYSPRFATQRQNDIKLIEYIRNVYGIKEQILLYLSW